MLLASTETGIRLEKLVSNWKEGKKLIRILSNRLPVTLWRCTQLVIHCNPPTTCGSAIAMENGRRRNGSWNEFSPENIAACMGATETDRNGISPIGYTVKILRLTDSVFSSSPIDDKTEQWIWHFGHWKWFFYFRHSLRTYFDRHSELIDIEIKSFWTF